MRDTRRHNIFIPAVAALAVCAGVSAAQDDDRAATVKAVQEVGGILDRLQKAGVAPDACGTESTTDFAPVGLPSDVAEQPACVDLYAFVCSSEYQQQKQSWVDKRMRNLGSKLPEEIQIRLAEAAKVLEELKAMEFASLDRQNNALEHDLAGATDQVAATSKPPKRPYKNFLGDIKDFLEGAKEAEKKAVSKVTLSTRDPMTVCAPGQRGTVAMRKPDGGLEVVICPATLLSESRSDTIKTELVGALAEAVARATDPCAMDSMKAGDSDLSLGYLMEPVRACMDWQLKGSQKGKAGPPSAISFEDIVNGKGKPHCSGPRTREELVKSAQGIEAGNEPSRDQGNDAVAKFRGASLLARWVEGKIEEGKSAPEKRAAYQARGEAIRDGLSQLCQSTVYDRAASPTADPKALLDRVFAGNPSLMRVLGCVGTKSNLESSDREAQAGADDYLKLKKDPKKEAASSFLSRQSRLAARDVPPATCAPEIYPALFSYWSAIQDTGSQTTAAGPDSPKPGPSSPELGARPGSPGAPGPGGGQEGSRQTGATSFAAMSDAEFGKRSAARDEAIRKAQAECKAAGEARGIIEPEVVEQACAADADSRQSGRTELWYPDVLKDPVEAGGYKFNVKCQQRCLCRQKRCYWPEAILVGQVPPPARGESAQTKKRNRIADVAFALAEDPASGRFSIAHKACYLLAPDRTDEAWKAEGAPKCQQPGPDAMIQFNDRQATLVGDTSGAKLALNCLFTCKCGGDDPGCTVAISQPGDDVVQGWGQASEAEQKRASEDRGNDGKGLTLYGLKSSLPIALSGTTVATPGTKVGAASETSDRGDTDAAPSQTPSQGLAGARGASTPTAGRPIRGRPPNRGGLSLARMQSLVNDYGDGSGFWFLPADGASVDPAYQSRNDAAADVIRADAFPACQNMIARVAAEKNRDPAYKDRSYRDYLCAKYKGRELDLPGYSRIVPGFKDPITFYYGCGYDCDATCGAAGFEQCLPSLSRLRFKRQSPGVDEVFRQDTNDGREKARAADWAVRGVEANGACQERARRLFAGEPVDGIADKSYISRFCKYQPNGTAPDPKIWTTLYVGDLTGAHLPYRCSFQFQCGQTACDPAIQDPKKPCYSGKAVPVKFCDTASQCTDPATHKPVEAPVLATYADYGDWKQIWDANKRRPAGTLSPEALASPNGEYLRKARASCYTQLQAWKQGKDCKPESNHGPQVYEASFLDPLTNADGRPVGRDVELKHRCQVSCACGGDGHCDWTALEALGWPSPAKPEPRSRAAIPGGASTSVGDP